jgi:DNA-binding protein HU-beta
VRREAWLSPSRNSSFSEIFNRGIARLVIGRAFPRPVGSVHCGWKGRKSSDSAGNNGVFVPARLAFRASISSKPLTSIKGTAMPKMTKSQLIDAISESSAISKNDVKAVIEHMATVGYKELNESGEFVIPGFVKMSVVNKPATEARSGINPFTKEPMEFAAKPASKTVKASPLKVAKDAV